MKRAILLIALLAAGCKHAPAPPPAEIREVLVPTPVTCVNPADIPREPPTVGQRFNGDAKHDLGILAPNARALREWGQKLRTLLEACVIKAPSAEPTGSSAAAPKAAETKPAQ
ncbi:hypothetical protein GRI75_10870 [Altererythrobacter soli]|uniref:Uncharacterized protein n=1 Tax=Croceibacterium soli TaxID=1739690 RepID=A0A6I4UTB5_9SPHN|nr:hypothetical protein [Croceibacterium soli]MXP42142.1 hypothetical protein [Croceibacterium soli]